MERPDGDGPEVGNVLGGSLDIRVPPHTEVSRQLACEREGELFLLRFTRLQPHDEVVLDPDGGVRAANRRGRPVD
eukprot:3971233-Pyramimonas_sp.AAC.2